MPSLPKLTNLDKVFWKKEGYTKGDVINYYEKIAKTILPYLKDRPMVLNRHPNGIAGESFFQKQIDAHAPSWIQRVAVKHTNKVTTYVMVQDVQSLLYVVNLGCIELNPFSSRREHLENPDYMIIDLDPEDISFNKVIEVALTVHDILDSIGMKNYCKTSGGRGLHIYVPLAAKYDFNQSQELAKLIGILAQSRLPNLVSLLHNPADRQKRIYIDFLRNSLHQTVASVYSIRPRPKAPVSTPLAWEELKVGLSPLDFTIETLPLRLEEKGDLFKPVLGRGINLKKGLAALQSLMTRE